MTNNKKNNAHNDLLAKQFWQDVTDSERGNWHQDEVEAVYEWVSDHLEKGAESVLVNIDVHDTGSVVTVMSRDCSFIIDSLTALVQRKGFTIAGLVHPVLTDSRLKNPVSVVSIRIKESLTDHEAAGLSQEIDTVMQDVILSTQDWQAMREKMRALIEQVGKEKDSDRESVAFLQYLCENNFTFLGYASTPAKGLKPEAGSLGVLSADRNPPLLGAANLPFPVSAHDKTNDTLVVFKLPLISTVHRPVRYDAVAVREKDAKGNIVREHIFLGLFTSVTYSRSIQDVPLLRRKAQAVIEDTRFATDHHDYKATTHILEKYPRDELFRIDLPTLKSFVKGIMRLQERQRIALFARPDHLTKNISVLVYIPRERYETRLRKQIQDILEREYEAVSEGFTVSLDDSPLVRVLFTLRAIHDNALLANAAEVEQTLVEETRSWQERLRNTITRELAIKYADAFSLGYQDHYGIETLVTDVTHIEQLLATQELQLELYRPKGTPGDRVRFKIYALNEAVALSNVLPILENFGFHVLSEQPFEITMGDSTIWLHDFYLCAKDENTEYDIAQLRPVFEESFAAIWRNAAANDSLNRLTTRAEMPVRHVMLLRAYTRYLHQIRIGYSPSYVISTLGDYPHIAGLLIDLFETRFDPVVDLSDREEKLAEIRTKIQEELGKVASLDQDTILRRMHNLIESTLRTNAFQRDAQGNLKDYISFKIDCAKVTRMADPRPMYEVFVFSARMEGVHLRFGKVSRGGLRWSDRPDDFRTEVLGLVKAQKVKNAVIVPTGAKGGFILKNPPSMSDRKAYAEEGIACYRILIQGLLDITDNLGGGDRVIRPAQVVCYDEEDPYLVVAADKGTASFSDIANGISADYGFWLGDAFASGGSVGYDHKEMGITAKGAWECVKRHFRELGKNIQEEDFTVIGVGDMGGDVFGNGMLLSPHIKLIGAFNHRHIFCDPEPNTAKSFAERERLFKEVSGWDQYKENVLSKGGRIFERSAKSLKLTKEIREKFGIDAEDITPDDLIRAMLMTPVELLYFGGIGTYIKDETESDADVADRANDRLRVNAQQIRASVIGEGANLGITQNARIVMDQMGIHLNTDFIDNSAGVDCSDHEVNIKILFNRIMMNSGLKVEERNVMLKDMTDAVSNLVLRDNYQQSMAISQVKMQGAGMLPQMAMTIDRLERDYGLMIKVEQLPTLKALEERQAKGQGLTRPEISILISHAKMALKKELLLTDIPDREDVAIWLRTYFPETLQKRYPDAIDAHPLRREIIATQMANSIVNRMGPHFLFEKQEQSGLSVASIVDAYLLGRDVLNLNALWRSIEQLDNQVENIVQMRLLEKTTRTLDRLIRRFLSLHGERLRLILSAPQLREQVAKIQPNLVDMLTSDLSTHYQYRMSQLKEQKVSKNIAEAVTLQPYIVMAIEAMQLNGKEDGGEMAIRTYFAVGQKFQIELLRQQARLLMADFPENARAISSLLDALMTAQAGTTLQILHAPGSDAQTKLNSWLSVHRESINAVDGLLRRLNEGHMLDLGRLVLIEQKLRQLSLRA